MLSVRAIAYVAGSVNGTPHLLVENTEENDSYTCIEVTCEEKDAEKALREEMNKKIHGISANLKEGHCITSFVDFEKTPHKTNRCAIYLFQLSERYSITAPYSFLSLDGLESRIEPPLDHGLKLLKHSYQHHLCSNSCSHVVQEKAVAFITRGKGKDTEILVLKKNAKLNNKGDNVGENEVIGGTIECGEDPHVALIREIQEESGIQPQQFNVEDKLTTYRRFNPHTKKINVRHVFHCPVNGEISRKWNFVVQGEGIDKNDHYDFEFVPLFQPLNIDAGLEQGVDLLRRKILTQAS